ncbi:MAG: hypothetical protein HY748_16090 [Elusimicrobia bacterium]|nr:hypothetical protein [Elusimicrobiota bacterium]
MLVLNGLCRSHMEHYHRLRTALQALLDKASPIVLTMTSAVVGEGKTLMSLNFCLAAASAGLKTLLIETDSERRCLRRILGISPSPGLSEVLSGDIHWRQCLRGKTDIMKGAFPLDDLRRDFQIIVFDCPPVLLFGEVMFMGRNSDGVVLNDISLRDLEAEYGYPSYYYGRPGGG